MASAPPPAKRRKRYYSDVVSDPTLQLRSPTTRVTALINHTAWADKYSHPIVTFPAYLRPANTLHPGLLLTERPDRRSLLKSGWTPVSPPRRVDGLSDDAIQRERGKSYLECVQRDTQLGFTTRELEAMDALGSEDYDDFEMSLDVDIDPIFAMRKWSCESGLGVTMPRHRAAIPILGLVDGTGRQEYWVANEDRVWKLLTPILQLATLILRNDINGGANGWIDALLAYSTNPSSFEHFTHVKSSKTFNLLRFRPRKFQLRSTDPDKAQMLRLLDRAAENIVFMLWSGYSAPVEDLPKAYYVTDGLTIKNYISLQCEVRISIETLQPLLRQNLTDTEKFTLYSRAAQVLLHELAHALWKSLEYNKGKFPLVDWDIEPYHAAEPHAELGYSYEDKLFNGHVEPFRSSRYALGGPGLAVNGFYKRNWFTKSSENYAGKGNPVILPIDSPYPPMASNTRAYRYLGRPQSATVSSSDPSPSNPSSSPNQSQVNAATNTTTNVASDADSDILQMEVARLSFVSADDIDPYLYEDIWPIPNSYFQDLFRKSIWDVHTVKFGVPPTHARPLVHGRRFKIPEDRTEINPFTVEIKSESFFLNYSSYDDSDDDDHHPNSQPRVEMNHDDLVVLEHEDSMNIELSPYNAMLAKQERDRTRKAVRISYALEDLDQFEKNTLTRDEIEGPLEEPLRPPYKCARYDEIKAYLMTQRGPWELALDSMTVLGEPQFYRYIRDQGGIALSAMEFRDFLGVANQKQELFIHHPFPGTGIVRRVNVGWPQRTTPHVKPSPSKPAPAEGVEFLKLLSGVQFQSLTAHLFRLNRDLDIETFFQWMGRIFEDEFDELTITERQYEDIVLQAFINGQPNFTLGPKNIIRFTYDAARFLAETKQEKGQPTRPKNMFFEPFGVQREEGFKRTEARWVREAAEATAQSGAELPDLGLKKLYIEEEEDDDDYDDAMDEDGNGERVKDADMDFGNFLEQLQADTMAEVLKSRAAKYAKMLEKMKNKDK